MSAFYYIAASLPFLSGPDQAPPMKSAELLELCGRMLSPKDYEDLLHGSLDPDAKPSKGLAGRYRMWERSLRNELAKRRGEEWGLEADVYLREADTVFGVQAIAAEAMDKATPLEAEIFLNNQRWSKIDEMACGHAFDMEFLRGYRLKLLLLERRALFSEERGTAAYRDIYKRVLETSGETQG